MSQLGQPRKAILILYTVLRVRNLENCQKTNVKQREEIHIGMQMNSQSGVSCRGEDYGPKKREDEGWRSREVRLKKRNGSTGEEQN